LRHGAAEGIQNAGVLANFGQFAEFVVKLFAIAFSQFVNRMDAKAVEIEFDGFAYSAQIA
jgi:hypothetical protein